jgi:hypothetical protein
MYRHSVSPCRARKSLRRGWSVKRWTCWKYLAYARRWRELAVPRGYISDGGNMNFATSVFQYVQSYINSKCRFSRLLHNNVRSRFKLLVSVLYHPKKISPVIVLSTVHSFLPRLQRFSQAASKTPRSRSMLARWCRRATVTISISAVSWRCVKPRFAPGRTLRRRRGRSRLRSCCPICAGRRPRSSWCGWRRWTRGSWRRWRRRLFDFFEIGGRSPTGGRVV